MGQLRQRIDVRDVAVRIAQSLDVDGAGVVLNRGLHLGEVMDVYEARGDAEVGQRMGQQVVAAAVDRLLGDKVTAVLTQRLKGVGDRRRTRSDCQTGHAALQRRDALLKHVLGGVGQAAVDVACVGQAEARRRVLTVAEHIGRGGINRHRAGIGRRIGGLLANVELKGFKLVIRHDDASFLRSNVLLCVRSVQHHIRPKRKLARTSFSK